MNWINIVIAVATLTGVVWTVLSARVQSAREWGSASARIAALERQVADLARKQDKTNDNVMLMLGSERGASSDVIRAGEA